MSDGNQNPGILIPPVGVCHERVRQAIQDIVRRLGTSSTPTYGSLTLDDLTASKLVAADANKKLASADIYDFVDGTTNQINKTNDGDGTMTLSTPQDIHAGASPTFVSETLSGLSASKLAGTDGDKLLESKDLSNFIAGTTNRVSVADDGDGTVTLSAPQDLHTAATPSFTGLNFETVPSLPGTVVVGEVIRLATDGELYLGKEEGV